MEEELTAEKLCSLDKPSVYVAGMVVAKMLQKMPMAVLMVDVLGRVVVMPPESVQVLHRPKLLDADLDALSEEEAITVMLKEERTEEEIVAYLKRRNHHAE